MDDGTRISENVEKFLRAARAKDVKECEQMLTAEPELVNSVEAGGYSALHFAAFNGDIDMIRMLTKHAADVNEENMDGNAPLVMAVKGRHLGAIEALVAAGADINRASETGSTALHYAASMGFMDCFRLLVKLGAKLHHEASETGSLLHWACHSGDVDCIGAMLYEFSIPIDTPDVHGGTPLLTALFMNKTQAVVFLLEHGANPNVTIREDGTTALHIAVEFASIDSVKALLEFGADPGAKNKDSESVLDVAMRANKTDAVKELSREQPSAAKKKEEAERFKAQGNKVFAQGENVKAAKFYTYAIHRDNTNHVYFSNRAASYFNQRAYVGALWDSCRCVTLKPDWAKGYLRKSATELALKLFNEALTTATAGLKLDASNKDLMNIRDEAHKLMKTPKEAEH